MWRKYLKKTDQFLHEAKIDIENGCYLKAISASYFAIEHILKTIAIKEFGSFPLKIGSLFSITDKALLRRVKSRDTLKQYRKLMITVRGIYNNRKNVDHLDYIPVRHEAEKILKDAELIVHQFSLLFRLRDGSQSN